MVAHDTAIALSLLTSITSSNGSRTRTSGRSRRKGRLSGAAQLVSQQVARGLENGCGRRLHPFLIKSEVGPRRSIPPDAAQTVQQARDAGQAVVVAQHVGRVKPVVGVVLPVEADGGSGAGREDKGKGVDGSPAADGVVGKRVELAAAEQAELRRRQARLLAELPPGGEGVGVGGLDGARDGRPHLPGDET